VRDASGNAIGDVGVSISVSSGGGTISGAPTKSSAGGTSVGTWTLGNTSGTNSLTISVSGLSAPLTISATGTADVATQINAVLGNSQSAVAATTLNTPVTFKVGDKFNNGVSGVTVSFQVVGGGGALPGGSATVVTDAGGLAVAPAWTLGKSTGAQQLRATAGALTGNATATVTSGYTIEVRYLGAPPEAAIQAAFTAAAARVQGLLTGDIQDIPLNNFNTQTICGLQGGPTLTETVDDLIIYAQITAIDGKGGVLGNAGPLCVRQTGELPLISLMNFDIADLQDLITVNQLGDVILHEMLHTVGVGTIWANKAQLSGASTSSVAFVGQQAVAGCLFHGGSAPLQCGSNTVPVEAGFGPGTANVHWRESTSATGIGLNAELMTGFKESPGIAMPLSRITIASLADVGYTVNLLPYDSYTYPSAAASALAQIREGQGMGKIQLNEILREPVARVGIGGSYTFIKPRQ
jgi:hypothetical protein